MNKTFLALSVNVLMIGGVYAADDVASASSQEKSAEQATATQSSEAPAQGSVFTESNSTAAQVRQHLLFRQIRRLRHFKNKKVMPHRKVIFKKFSPPTSANIL